MHLTMQGTQFLNPGQTSVLGADQPIYAIAKQLQWTFSDILGEDNLVLMRGALHIEGKIDALMSITSKASHQTQMPLMSITSNLMHTSISNVSSSPEE